MQFKLASLLGTLLSGILLLLLADGSYAAYKLQERYSWNQLDFAFPNQRLKEEALAVGDYIPQNALPVGVEHFGNKLFVTIPRWRDAIATATDILVTALDQILIAGTNCSRRDSIGTLIMQTPGADEVKLTEQCMTGDLKYLCSTDAKKYSGAICMQSIPATLTYINMDHSVTGSPELIPYPDWRSNTAGDCANSLTTVYRIKVDECGRLWVLDTGTLGIGNTTTNPCPYAVNIYDLATNTRIRRYELRAEDTNANTFIASIAVDVGKNCDDAFAYFSDELGYGLVVYSWEQNKSWRFSSHSYFFPDPLRGDYNIAGLNFQWGEEGIFGMALSPIRSDGFRTMYFSPLASHREFAVSTRILRDESRVEDSYHDFVPLDERGPNSHTTSRVMSDDGVMLFNLIDQNAVGCWHSSMPYSPQFHGIVDRDDVGLVFPADVKIDENKNVWVLSDRMPVFLLSDLDYNDVNFRIYSAPFTNLIEGTICDLRSNAYGPSNSVATKQPLNPYGTKNLGLPRPTIQQRPLLQPSKGYLPPLLGPLPPVTYTTQKNPIAKAFVYNQHNGISYETGGPQTFPGVGLRDFATTRSSWWNQ